MGHVTLDSVTKRYGDVRAVEEMDLEIEDGEFVTLVGPSGCGKSTTLETIAGLTKPSEGTITIAGRDVTNLPPKDRGIAMVFQNIALFPHMDVYDNISFGLRLRDFDTEEIDRRVERAAEIVQLNGMLDRMPDELSGGQRQRVGIARAIVREPEAFLMDEPLANLDAKLRVHMRTELQRLHKQLETTIIYVTHDQAEAMTMSDRIAVLNEGELQQIAAPLTCYDEPANRFVAGFIGSPSMNFVDGEVGGDGVETAYFDAAVDASYLDDLADGAGATVGVRPEDVVPADRSSELEHPSDPAAATVDVLQPMGDRIFVHLLLDSEARGASDPRSTPSREDAESHGDSSPASQARQDADRELLMSVDADSALEADQRIEVVLDRANLHLFDATTGEAIAHGVAEARAAEETTEDRSVATDD